MSVLREYLLLVRWNAMRAKAFLAFAGVIQAMFSLGIVLGYPLLFPSMDRMTVLYIATAAPAITLITMGLVAVPQQVAQARTEGTFDYMRTLPIPRAIYLLSDLTVQLGVVLPGVAFGVLIATWRFALPIEVSPWIVPSVVLVVLTATSIGYAIASILPPLMANLMSQVLVVLVFMFSPLQFPADRLPDWAAAMHRILPIQAMGEVMRGSLAPGTFAIPGGAFLLLGAWCAVCFGIAWRVMARRG